MSYSVQEIEDKISALQNELQDWEEKLSYHPDTLARRKQEWDEMPECRKKLHEAFMKEQLKYLLKPSPLVNLIKCNYESNI